MDIARLKVRITIEKLTMKVDEIGNHTNGWEDYYSCYAYANTYMSGYSKHTANKDKTVPDFELLEECVKNLDIPVVCEGRVHTPEQAVEALDRGAFAVVVGGAITRPLEIATRFIKAVDNR